MSEVYLGKGSNREVEGSPRERWGLTEHVRLEGAQPVRHEDLTLDPQQPCQLQPGTAVIAGLGEPPGSHRPASLAEPVSPRSVRDPASKREKRGGAREECSVGKWGRALAI